MSFSRDGGRSRSVGAGGSDSGTRGRGRGPASGREMWLAWVLAAAMAVGIFAMSAHTGQQLDSSNELISIIKRWLAGVASAVAGHEVDVSPVGHATEYFVFGALLNWAFVATKQWRTRTVGVWAGLAVLAVVVASLYGVTDELHQLFVPGRACDPADWAVDAVFAGLGALVARALMRRRVRRGAGAGVGSPKPVK